MSKLFLAFALLIALAGGVTVATVIGTQPTMADDSCRTC
jgi:hypothetical protein